MYRIVCEFAWVGVFVLLLLCNLYTRIVNFISKWESLWVMPESGIIIVLSGAIIVMMHMELR